MSSFPIRFTSSRVCLPIPIRNGRRQICIHIRNYVHMIRYIFHSCIKPKKEWFSLYIQPINQTRFACCHVFEHEGYITHLYYHICYKNCQTILPWMYAWCSICSADTSRARLNINWANQPFGISSNLSIHRPRP